MTESGHRSGTGPQPDGPLAIAPAPSPAVIVWRRCALGGGGGMFVGMGLGRFSYTAMVPALVESGGLSPVDAGRVGTVNLAGFLAGAVASVVLARHFGRAVVLRGALLLSLAGLAASALPWGFTWLATCRGGLGFGTALIMVLSLALIAETAPADRRPEAGAYVFAGVGLGIVMAGLLVPWLLASGLMAAWLGILVAGLVGGGVAIWGWSAAPNSAATATVAVPADATSRKRTSIFSPGMAGLMLAHGLFSFGIVPHTIYWVDFLVRGLGLGVGIGGMHWGLVGIAAAVGPLLTARLARAFGTAAALCIGFWVLAIGIAVPALLPATAVLVASSLIFGAQPGLSSLMAARARDLGDPAEIPRVMRAMILANAAGGMAGGLIVPWIYGAGWGAAFGAAGDHAPLFVLGGAAMALGALAAWPRRQVGA
ncbi:MAG: YbfB/YjiJ family MFS transporter [Hyphomicrobiaceae bacterium]